MRKYINLNLILIIIFGCFFWISDCIPFLRDEPAENSSIVYKLILESYTEDNISSMRSIDLRQRIGAANFLVVVNGIINEEKMEKFLLKKGYKKIKRNQFTKEENNNTINIYCYSNHLKIYFY